ncbi:MULTISPECIES: L-rhamnonate dehydratase [unclassified Roseitalea]|uniref:L-rhamnonate dehydratase n=1 Tax=unclassified Roseitalea TaxID=2639107 RepID=UPI00273EA177|nr:MULTISPECIES: L-rhamnonate dehydratase [unclassified Roseitalea]
MQRWTIADIRAHTIDARGAGGDYHDRHAGHWLIDSPIATPMSAYPAYKRSRTSWGIDVLGSILVEIETEDGTIGIATGLGGDPACFLIERHFRRFLIGADIRDIARLWDQMYRASLPYGRKGVTLAALSVVDLALWDGLGRLRGEPVYKMIGGRTRDELRFYCTGPRPDIARQMGFWGGKVPLPLGPADGRAGLAENRDFLARHRDAVGPDFALMVDCYMALDVPYAVDLAYAVRDLDINWIEEPLSPDDVDGHRLLKQRAPFQKWTTGEHEFTRYGYRDLVASRAVDIIQPDMMWLGGLTEALRLAAMAAAYDIAVVPHGSGAYSYHYVMSQPNCPFCEYLITSPEADRLEPVFGTLFENEAIPQDGRLVLSDEPGFGLELNRGAVPLNRPYAES